MAVKENSGETQRSLGRIEGGMANLAASVASLQASMALVQVGVAAITQDNIQCHTDRLEHTKRLNKIEHRQYWVAGASAAFGMVAGWFGHLSGILPR